MREIEVELPDDVRSYLRETIRRAHGNEVFFLARVAWDEEGREATVADVDVFARGNRGSVLAVIEGAEEWDLAIHNHPGGSLEPSSADQEIAHELSVRGVGFAIIDNSAASIYLVVPPRPREAAPSLDSEEVGRMFEPGGPLASRLEAYEARRGQVEMALEVTRALNEGAVVACEAGTGVGKSFAYLVPAILWAVRNRERVVISTGTINLQEQLAGRDLPFLQRAIGTDFRFAIIKGRGNYACRRKISELADDFETWPPEPDERRMLQELANWSETTDDGSLADLAWKPPGDVWERVASETDRSLKVNCRFYDRCFYYQAKRTAFQAHVVVVNHHLYFADLAVRRETGNYDFDLVLPGYQRVIFDEAHHLEDVASQHLGIRFTRRGVRQRLARMRSPDGRRGATVILESRLRRWGDATASRAIADGFGASFGALAQGIDEELDELERLVGGSPDVPRAGEAVAGTGPGAGPGPPKIRYRPGGEDRGLWDLVRERLARVRGDLELISQLNDDAGRVLRDAAILEERRERARLEIDAFGRRLEGLIASIDRFCDLDDGDLVRWIDPGARDGAGRGASIGFHAAPIRVSRELKDAVYDRLDSVMLTSATLSVAGRAEFLADRLGLHLIGPERFAFRTFESPFDFERQVLCACPTDVAAPGSPRYEAELPGHVLSLLLASGGRAFVLFTSYHLLRRTHSRVARELAAHGIRPLAQGDVPRSELLDRFREAGNAVLFGTDSFWEGVDVKGRALECVIITRLPFRVPSDPLQEARMDDIEGQGLNAFSHFTVPQAVLRFKQGFGRLIRSTRDRGVVAVLDPRVLTRPYGKTFLASLPRTRFVASSLTRVRREIELFLGESGSGSVAPGPGADGPRGDGGPDG